MQHYEIHPICEIIPPMSDDDLHRLVEDISANGLMEAITLYEGKILDGRHRYEACLRTGIEPRFVDFDGPDAIKFVLSHNISRRHLTPSQLSMVGARAANMRSGSRTDLEPSANLHEVSLSEAAEKVGVSRRSVATAKKVIDSGKRDVVDAVDAGKLSISAAASIIDEPEEVRREIIGSGPRRQPRKKEEPVGGVASNVVELFLEVWSDAGKHDRRTIYEITRRWAEGSK